MLFKGQRVLHPDNGGDLRSIGEWLDSHTWSMHECSCFSHSPLRLGMFVQHVMSLCMMVAASVQHTFVITHTASEANDHMLNNVFMCNRVQDWNQPWMSMLVVLMPISGSYTPLIAHILTPSLSREQIPPSSLEYGKKSNAAKTIIKHFRSNIFVKSTKARRAEQACERIRKNQYHMHGGNVYKQACTHKPCYLHRQADVLRCAISTVQFWGKASILYALDPNAFGFLHYWNSGPTVFVSTKFNCKRAWEWVLAECLIYALTLCCHALPNFTEVNIMQISHKRVWLSNIIFILNFVAFFFVGIILECLGIRNCSNINFQNSVIGFTFACNAYANWKPPLLCSAQWSWAL